MVPKFLPEIDHIYKLYNINYFGANLNQKSKSKLEIEMVDLTEKFNGRFDRKFLWSI